MKYVPFLKLKTNEIRAIGDLTKNIKDEIIPFFDVSYQAEMTKDLLKKNILSMKEHLKKAIDNNYIYIDDYDLIDANYKDYLLILNILQDLNVIPVISLNREDSRINDVKTFFKENKSKKKIAFRLFLEDIESFKFIKEEFQCYYNYFSDKIDCIDIIIDLRVIIPDRLDYIINRVDKFLKEFSDSFSVNSIIITGSSITGNISTNSEEDIIRLEYYLWNKLSKPVTKNIIYGDYTFISPEYIEPTISVGIMQNVMTPKVYYTYNNNFFVKRGSSFKSHNDGYAQYFSIAQKIISKDFYRGKDFSEGDNYVYERGIYPRSAKIKKAGSPSSWIKAMINSHITYITNLF